MPYMHDILIYAKTISEHNMNKRSIEENMRVNTIRTANSEGVSLRHL